MDGVGPVVWYRITEDLEVDRRAIPEWHVDVGLT